MADGVGALVCRVLQKLDVSMLRPLNVDGGVGEGKQFARFRIASTVH